MIFVKRVLPVVTVALIHASPAAAHQSSHSYSTLRVDDKGTILHELSIPTSGLTAPSFHRIFDIAEDAEPSSDQLEQGKDRLVQHVLENVRFVAESGTACQVESEGFRVRAEPEKPVDVQFLVRCPTPGKVFLQYDLFFDVDPKHSGWVRVVQGESVVENVFKEAVRQHEITVMGGLGWGDYLVSGVEHIFTGFDHIAFVIGLLIVTVLRRRDAGWQPRGIRAGLGLAVPIVTAFTLAHSVTLSAAALDKVDVSARIVETLIAASIVYVAAENCLNTEARYRWALAFGFGLIHGLGFASLLRPILPPDRVVLPLLAFNGGIELGQLAILLVVYPVLHLLAVRNPARYRRVVVLGGSVLIGVLGAIWLVERATGIVILRT